MMRVAVLLGILAGLICLAALPARPLWRVLLSAVCGLGCLIVLNLLSPLTGMLFELNALTAAVAGFLGLPGVGCLLVAHFILSH